MPVDVDISIEEYALLMEKVKNTAIAKAKNNATAADISFLEEWPELWPDALKLAIAEAEYRYISAINTTPPDQGKAVKTFHYLTALRKELTLVVSYLANVDAIDPDDISVIQNDHMAIQDFAKALSVE